jgi:hypothetical protein
MVPVSVYVQPKRRADLRPVSLEALLAGSRLRARGDRASFDSGFFASCANADLQLEVGSCEDFVFDFDLDEQAVGYEAVWQQGSELRVLSLLLVPALLRAARPRVVAWRRDWSVGASPRELARLLFQFNGPGQDLKPVKWDVDQDSLYLSWPDGNPHAVQRWILRRPCVPDEDTRRCTARLEVSWRPAPPELLRFPAWDLQRLLLLDASEAQSQSASLSDAELIAVYVAAGVWAVIVLVVVAVLFVKLKKKS